MEPLDLLAVVAHPDDAELLFGGSLLVSMDRGARTGILDLTRGETGSRGAAETKARKAVRAGEVFPGGGRALEGQIRANGAKGGALVRVEYGEPFWTRETVQRPSLGVLPVSTY